MYSLHDLAVVGQYARRRISLNMDTIFFSRISASNDKDII